MALVLGPLDWLLVACLVVAASSAAFAAATWLSRRYADEEVAGLRNQLRLLELRLAGLERQRAVGQPLQSLPPETHSVRLSRPLPERPARAALSTQPPIVDRSMETLTQDAAAALTSLDAFRLFVQAEGGSGFVIAPGSQSCQPVPGNDPVSASDLWAVPFEGGYLYFPGWNLRRTQSALLADSGRMARDRLGWLFDIEAGTQLAAFRPAFQRPGEDLERGLLTLAF